jgi:hypothetical protein
MDYQTPYVKRRADNAPTEPLTELVSGIGQNLTTLIELQIQLAAADLRTAVRRMVPPLGMCATALCIAFAACPILGVAIAELIVRFGHMERGFAYLLVAVVALVISGILVAVAIPLAMKSWSVLDRSKEEFFTNLRSLGSAWSNDATRQDPRQAPPIEHNGKR